VACQDIYVGNGGKPLILTPLEIYMFAKQGGFDPTHAVVVTAISLAESNGGAKNVINDCPATGDYSFGLMQVNLYGSLMAPRMKEFGLSDSQQLLDPLVNMKAAHQIFKDAGDKFTPWSTYKSGAYASHLGVAQDAAKQYDKIDPSLLNSIEQVGGDVGSAEAGAAGAAVGAAAGFLGDFGLGTILKLAFAALLGIFGFYLLFHQPINSAAKRGAEIGAMA
jgi:hypothetical protein